MPDAPYLPRSVHAPDGGAMLRWMRVARPALGGVGRTGVQRDRGVTVLQEVPASGFVCYEVCWSFEWTPDSGFYGHSEFIMSHQGF